MRPQNQKRFAEAGEHEQRADSDHAPIGTPKAPQVFHADRIDARRAWRAPGLAYTEQQQGDGKERRDHGDPEHGAKVVGPQQHQRHRKQRPEERADRVERLA